MIPQLGALSRRCLKYEAAGAKLEAVGDVFVCVCGVQEMGLILVSALIRVVALCQHLSEIIISDGLVSLSDCCVWFGATELPWGGVCGVI